MANLNDCRGAPKGEGTGLGPFCREGVKKTRGSIAAKQKEGKHAWAIVAWKGLGWDNRFRGRREQTIREKVKRGQRPSLPATWRRGVKIPDSEKGIGGEKGREWVGRAGGKGEVPSAWGATVEQQQEERSRENKIGGDKDR